MHDIHHKFIVFTRDSRENRRLSRQALSKAAPFPPNPLLFWRTLLDKLNERKVHLIMEEKRSYSRRASFGFPKIELKIY